MIEALASRTDLAQEVNRRVLRIMAVTGLVGSLLTALLLAVVHQMERQEHLRLQAEDLAALTGTILQAEDVPERRQRLLQLYLGQSQAQSGGAVVNVLVVNEAGRVVLSSRQGALGQRIVTLEKPAGVEADGTLKQIQECFRRGGSLFGLCLRRVDPWAHPWENNITLARPVVLPARGQSQPEQTVLAVITLSATSHDPETLGMMARSVGLSLLLLLLLLSMLTVALYRGLLPSLRRFAETDGLTQLINRRTFMDLAAKRLEAGAGEGAPYALAMLDIDRFKSINDTYSHLCGDEVLRRVAVVLTRSLREEDLVARLGGEEFGVLLQCSAPRAEALMERLRREVAAIRPEWENQEIPVTISIGLASSEFLGHNLQYLYAAADAALYQAKTEGRNTVRRAHRLVERRSDAGALPEG